MNLKRFTLSQQSTPTNNNSSLSKKVDYYTEIQHNFLQLFQQKWKKEMQSVKISNIATKEHSIKPLMMAWGYYADATNFNHDSIADCTIAIELLYQASKLLDTNPEAVSLINRGITLLTEKNNKLDFTDIRDLERINSQILNNATEDITEFLNSAIEKLISNTFFLGFCLTEPNAKYTGLGLTIQVIGESIGSCIQMLNDLSEFTSSNKTQISQNNIIISYLRGACTRKEREQLDSNFDIEYINNLIHKYKIENIILEYVKSKIFFTKNSRDILERVNPDYYADFSRFLNETFKSYFQKCGLTYENML